MASPPGTAIRAHIGGPEGPVRGMLVSAVVGDDVMETCDFSDRPARDTLVTPVNARVIRDDDGVFDHLTGVRLVNWQNDAEVLNAANPDELYAWRSDGDPGN